jgi:hypothetical protein
VLPRVARSSDAGLHTSGSGVAMGYINAEGYSNAWCNGQPTSNCCTNCCDPDWIVKFGILDKTTSTVKGSEEPRGGADAVSSGSNLKVPSFAGVIYSASKRRNAVRTAC